MLFYVRGCLQFTSEGKTTGQLGERYDGRGALGDLRVHEPPSGGFDQRTVLTEDELKVEQLCDEERYRSLYNNDAEESMYHEEEMKRLHQALGSEHTYGQVAYNYDDQDSQTAIGEDSQSPKPSDGSQEDDQAFVLPPELEVPEGTVLPETQKLDAIITKTALFISRQGSQMEILIKAKQANNPQFSFLSIDGPLHPYYKIVLEAIKSGKFNPEKPLDKEESTSEASDDDEEGYLHPSLASSLSKVEAAPSIPSIQYKPSADCAYSMLVNKITGKPPPSRTQHPPPPPDVPVQQMPPLGYYPPMPMQAYAPYPLAPQQYSHGPVIYGLNGQVQSPPHVSTPPTQLTESLPTAKDTPAPLVPYGTTPPKPLSRPSFIVPPADIQIIIDKMASYVAKNGRDFEAIVKAKGDPRFNFLELSHQYHGYYAHKLTIYEGAINPKVLTEEELLRKQETQEEKQKKLEELQKKQQRMEEVQKRVKMIQAKKKGDKQITTVSFSIKKPKEGETIVIEKRSALPMEESDDEGDDEKGEKEEELKSATPEPPEPPRISESLRKNSEEKELVDLTDDILEDCQNQIRLRQAEDKIKDKLAAAARDKLAATSRERLLQIERRKKAAMFLSTIQASSVPKPVVEKIDDDSDEVHSIPSPTLEDSTSKKGNSLMSRLKSADLGINSTKVRSKSRSKSRSRSRSQSRSRSSRHRYHRKHKKKKSSHKSYDSPSSSRSQHSKRSKKSSTRHRTRSRSPSRRYQGHRTRSDSSASSSLSS
ncbi:splicing factor, suppressor of white-apricot homolog isoform X2 [Fopius arisanus]|uniref:Splicing factor, suppressor of white-apricot homolog isoform X2 n=1 Tax=Fopius arisanus TaxID=64838 RepID=A0A9R1U345_9HYME|nr:PREDICTED: splicing factor, suppressor of white-apricot homolog isoform X2 [Fopius arisanus]